MMDGMFIFGIPMIIETLGGRNDVPAGAGKADSDDSVEVTGDVTRAYVLTMLATGTANASGMGSWGNLW